ncbi:cysteine dioxygenase type 1 [Cephus cinctus]|uniref:Cysteine dioxygenase n=1 Tax=Cephus cinctus TaxID=211228 RepID=A0AAJ7FRG4_CEPCN|nr:cysteine dioxygenase type 1 [Cephus cinctus]
MDVCTPDSLYHNNNNNNKKNTLHQNNKYNDLLQGKVSTLQELIDQLYNAFNTDVVDIDHVQAIMASYKSNPQEWKKYAKFDRYRYTRNLVDEGNGKFNLMILCWGEGHGSAIHDHANAHCVMKVLQGELLETKYDWPRSCRDSGDNEEPEELQETNKNAIGLNHVCYINDSIGLHRVENPSTVNPAVSLHLYSPPFSSCSVFNKQTGQKSVCNVIFWSKYGERRSRNVQDARAPEDN